ncbi:MAG: single-strand binding protein [Solirubrobacterales bacterium]|nr:single-strand binding protein [Solirubrobacterales bacterium]
MNINNVTLTGNLTRDPDLRELESGTKVANLRPAVNGRRSGDGYVDTVDYFNVAVFGAQAESCDTYLAKGRPIAVEGRLDWREVGKGEERREYVKVIAEAVQFLGRKPDAESAEDSAQEALPEAEPVAA